jgi:hypothetical protein
MFHSSKNFKRGDIQTSFTQFILAAERGFLTAQVNTAYMLDTKLAPQSPLAVFDPNSDWNPYAFALPLYLRAANQGHVDSRVRVGDFYFYGYLPSSANITNDGVTLSMSHWLASIFKPEINSVPSYEHAIAHYSAAAEGEYSHSSIAMFNLGFMYEYGMGVEKDYHLAKRWYDYCSHTNPGAFLPVQISLTFLNLKWLLSDLYSALFDPKIIPDIHPPMPLDEEEEILELTESLISQVEMILVVSLVVIAGYLLFIRRRLVNDIHPPATTMGSGAPPFVTRIPQDMDSYTQAASTNTLQNDSLEGTVFRQRRNTAGNRSDSSDAQDEQANA